ncbi:MAG: hypothetical protein EZS28_026173 [Streblomastix strix]|uniref:Uncharacterized protein n=1 Tax=Streblomastix strix TaxID=222440 RepID=A0A5J4V7F5_9EUKA|nr:MAG: hypothetical protein EZS28_026173 [Streblomastix strix]
MSTNPQDALKSSLLKSTFDNPESKVIVKAEDVQQGASVDFNKIYFQPEFGKTYDIKLLPSIGEESVNTHQVYKSLPDPDRKGKTFRYISSGNSKTCSVLQLFFDLNNLQKQGDVQAEQKIKKYLGKVNEACVTVQIQASDKPEEVGIFRLFSFSNFGLNAYLAKLIDSALNPSEKDLADGEAKKEDLFNIFDSLILRLVCEKSTFPDPVTGQPREGRDFSKSKWLKKRGGAIAVWTEGEEKKTYKFSADDYKDGIFTNAEATAAFDKLAESLLHEDLSVRNWFMYTPLGHEKNTKRTNEYLESVLKKVEEIVPVIEKSSLKEIANYGRKESETEGKEGDSKTSNKDGATDIYNEAIPEELKGSTVFESKGKTKEETKPAVETKVEDEKTKDLKKILDDDDE